MASPLISFLTGLGSRRVVETVVPDRTLADVILPPQTRRTLDQALAEVRNHNLIFQRWGLGERHATGRGLAFNFAGPPGTGKTICAEAIAHALGRKLLVVDYAEAESMWIGETPKNIVATFRAAAEQSAEAESMWIGETPKNIVATFRAAAEQNAVLFFDEADAIASRRSSGSPMRYERESNLTVNVLLRELESFNGIVIFATNLAANFDPAFERRIRTHVLFEMPGVEERERIWQLQVHPRKTPLGHDVNFRALAQLYAMSGGDIKNAVIKAAAAAAAEPGSDLGKHITQSHLETAARDVLAAKTVMQQSLFEEDTASGNPMNLWQALEARWRTAMIVTLALSGTAFVAALVALGLVILR